MNWFTNSSSSEERTIISLFMVVVIVALLFLMFIIELPENNKEMAYLVVGGLMGSFTTIIAFWFGSSKGSSDKTDILKQNQNQ